MAELGIDSESTKVAASALSDQQPTACHQSNSAAAPEANESFDRPHGALAESAGRTSPSAETMIPRSSTLGDGESKYEREAGNDQLKSNQTPSTDFRNLADESAELVQAVTEVNRIVSDGTVDELPIPKAAEKPSIGKPGIGRPTPYKPETILRSRRAGETARSTKASSNSSQSTDQVESHQVADPFLDDLSRQLDSIRLVGHRYPKS